MDAMRPGIRRKSSASHLLTQFKPGQGGPGGPHQLNGAPMSSTAPAGSSVLGGHVPGLYNGNGPISSAAYAPVSSAGYSNGPSSYLNGSESVGSSTPTGMGRNEWETQSSSNFSETSAATSSTMVGSNTSGGGSGAGGVSTTVEALRDMIQKRIMTLTYLRNTHEGKGHWFGTILSSRTDLDKVFNNTAMKKRTHRFAILGMSLANMFDVHPAPEYLKAVLNLLAEFDTFHEEGGTKAKPKKTRLFNRTSKMPKRGVNDFSASFQDPESTSSLITPSMPFNLDYHQTLISFLDIVTEVYQKLLAILGPSPMASLFSNGLTTPGPNTINHNPMFPPNPSAGLQIMMGPLGVHSPHPGLLSVFGGAGVLEDSSEGSLWALAGGGSSTIGSAGGAGLQPLHSPPPAWGPSLGDTINKIDLKFKKIIMTLVKEMDAFVRNAIKDELASLDPLLRNVSSIGAGAKDRDNVFEAAEGPWGV